MSNKVDLVPLIEWAIKRNAPETIRTRKTKEDKPVNVFDLLQQKRQEAILLENFIKDMEKINKKEDKKDDKKDDKKWHERINTPQLAMVMIIFVPIYMSFLQKFLH